MNHYKKLGKVYNLTILMWNMTPGNRFLLQICMKVISRLNWNCSDTLCLTWVSNTRQSSSI